MSSEIDKSNIAHWLNYVTTLNYLHIDTEHIKDEDLIGMIKKFITALFVLVILGVNSIPTAATVGFEKNTDNAFNLLGIVDSDVLEEVEDILSKRFNTSIKIASIFQLSEPERRNLILRIRLKDLSSLIPKSLIFKQAIRKEDAVEDKDSFNKFIREVAGLTFLSGLEKTQYYVPQLYGYSVRYQFVLVEDFGEKHVSLVDSLTNGDFDEARVSLERFMIRLGQLHGESYQQKDKYLQILQAIHVDVPTLHNDFESTFREVSPKLELLLKRINLPYTTRTQSEVNMVIKSVLETSPFLTFTHGDGCPDNVFDDPASNQLRLIDFESSFLRSALLDAVYLRMSMPTCWCAKSIPEELIESCEQIYRQELMKHISESKDDESYYTNYIYACAFWMLKSLAYAEEVLDQDIVWFTGYLPKTSLWNPAINLAQPRVLSRLEAFILVSKKYDKLPHIRFMAEQVLRTLKDRWHYTKPMSMYPSFSAQ